MGGVSSWCDLLVNGLTEFDWQVLPIVAARRPAARVRAARPRPRGRAHRGVVRGATAARAPAAVPATRCRAAARDPRAQPARLGRRPGRRGRRLGVVPPLPRRRAPRLPLRSRVGCVPRRACARCWTSASPRRGRRRRSTSSRRRALYQTLYWVARTAAAPTPAHRRPPRDRRGLVGDPRLVHKALHGTPMVLTEHGVYVREAYLGRGAQRRRRRAAASPRPGWRAAWRAPRSGRRRGRRR